MASSSSFVNLLASQGSVDLDSLEPPLFSTQSPQESSVKEKRKLSVKEDLILIEYYNSSPLLVGTVPRELGQCKQRWVRINDLVCKFAGCYDMALREQRSGQNDNDLRHDVKWCSTYMEKDKDKRKKVDSPVPEPEDRPIGVKAAKAAGKRHKTGKDEELTKLQGLMEMKKQISKQSLLESLLAKPEPLTEMELALKTKLLSELLS
uniref:No apical meristem-associated C-terminal domain-containing protein n=1 Tax=Brassica oleracea var. oleracea TaxID=109376 RepID=A0A0D3DDG4_BRAOL